MLIKFENCHSGVAISVTTEKGTLEAMVYPPKTTSAGDKHRICFGTAGGEFTHFQGMTSDIKSLELAKSMIRRIANGEIKQADGFISTEIGLRGYFAVHMKSSSDGFEDPQSSGHASQKTQVGAQLDALKWGEAEGLPVYLKPNHGEAIQQNQAVKLALF